MRAVSYRVNNEFERAWANPHDVQPWLDAVLSGRIDFECYFLSVRYDNGQLCTFRRKSPPQGGEG